MFYTVFEKAHFKGRCDCCGTDNKVMYSVNPYWETGGVDGYLCAKCKNRFLKLEQETNTKFDLEKE